MPGFRGHGSPTKQLAAEERACERRIRDKCDEGYQDAMREAEGDPWRRLEGHPAVEEVRDAGPGEVPDAAGEGAGRGYP